MVLGRCDNEFQTAHHYEEDDGEEDSDGGTHSLSVGRNS